MLTPTFFAAVLAASSVFVAALPAAKQIPQDVTALSAADELISNMVYNTVSIDGSCGGTTGYTCEGSVYGNCCSISGFCGATESFCGANCFPAAGLCSIRTGSTQKKANKPVIEEEEYEPVEEEPVEIASPVVVQPAAVHTPWKPTPFHDPQYKPSYVIDNGERAPNQVWN